MSPTARSIFNFASLMAFVVFELGYMGTLAGMWDFVGGGDDVGSNAPSHSARAWATAAVVAALVFLVTRTGAKVSPEPTTAEDYLRDTAWNTNSKYSSEGPLGALAFERSPLAALRVASSGPSLEASAIQRSSLTMVRASLPTGDGSTRPIGTCLAWCGVEGDLPALSLVMGDFDPALMTAFGDDELDLSEYDLVFPWRAFGSLEACAEVLKEGMEGFLNSVGDEGLALHLEPHRVVVWSDRGGSSDQLGRFDSLASRCVFALPRHLSKGGEPSSLAVDGDAGESRRLRRLASLGDLMSASKIRSRLFNVWAVLGLLALPPVVVLGLYVVRGVPFFGGRTGLIATGILLAIAVVTAGPSWLSWHAMKRLDAKHEAIALQVRSVASDANLMFRPRAGLLENGWTRRPFSVLKNLGAAPSASARRPWGSLGVAYIEGDYGAGLFLIKAFQSRVAWAQVSGGLPRMDLVREGFSSRAAKLIGGTELDTESFEFNELWRVKTDHPQEAHALLQPRMIEFLTTTAEQGIAIHLDGDRVVIWDDGSDEVIDLAARLALVERFVDCLPSQLRPTGDAKKRAN